MMQSDVTKNINRLLLLLFTAGVGVYFLATPPYADDLYYMLPLKEGNSLIDFWNDHLRYMNARVANLAVAPVAGLPLWVGKLISLAAWVGIMAGTLRIARVDLRRSMLIPAVLLMWLLFIPWGDGMGTLVFQFNYILAGGLGLTVTCFWATLRSHPAQPNGCIDKGENIYRGLRRTGGVMLAGAVGLLTGVWQEATSIPLLAGFAVMLLWKRSWRTPAVIALSIGLLAGAMWIVTGPAALSRYAGIGEIERSIVSRIFRTIRMFPGEWLLYLLTVVLAVKRGGKAIRDDNTLLFLLISTTTSVGVSFLTTGDARSGWWSCVGAVPAILIVMQKLWPGASGTPRVWLLISGLVACIFTFGVQTYGCVLTLRMRGETERAIERYKADPGATVFIDMTTPSGTPLLAELWADTDAEFNRFYLANVQFYYHPGHPYMQVPVELRRVTADTGEAVGEDGMRKYGDYFFVPYEGEDMNYFECKGRAVYDGYTKDGADIYCIPFISEREGHKYLWIYPHVNTIVHKFKTLRRIDL